MPINPFFNNYRSKQEQNLVEELIGEAIKMMGFDAYYIPNTNVPSRDLLYGDDPLKKFEVSYPIEVYMSNSVDPGMENDFFSKFGLEIKNNVRVQLPRRSFAKRVPQDSYTRPQEGDLLYIPWLSGTGELYEIKFVNDTTDFFTLGRKSPYYWELELELFKYSNEEIVTGVEEIDQVIQDSAYTIQYQLTSGNGNYILKEIVYQSEDLTIANSICYATVSDWNVLSNVLSVTNISGPFSNNISIIGQTSNASYIIQSYDPLLEPIQHKDAFDNKVIEEESDPFIITDENNPFGSIGSGRF